MIERLDETIVAISSPPGYGALGIVRLSGDSALRVADQMVRTSNGVSLADQAASTRTVGEILLDLEVTLPAHIFVFRSPQSYTRQDLVEIQTVGAPVALEWVRRRAVELGAEPAEAGEFTARAFLSGAMDLAEAEAVASIIQARSDTQLRASRCMMDGGLSRAISAIRSTLAELMALVEADIDFSEEPIEFITPAALGVGLTEITRSLKPLLARGASAQRWNLLPRILLLGPANAGKSSLMNSLSGTKRSICAAAAGTTRDILSSPVRLGRGEAVLLDSAGLDQSDDEIIAAAQAATIKEIQRVDVICIVLDVTRSPESNLEFARIALQSFSSPRVVVAANKCDLLSENAVPRQVEPLQIAQLGRVCPVSALTGWGIDTLRKCLADTSGAQQGTISSEALLLTERQRASVRDALDALGRARELTLEAAETSHCADLLAFELRVALDALGTIAGAVTTEELLGQVFSRFCIGK